MNILGIDYGRKNIGLAWVDTELGVVLPMGKVECGKWKADLVNLIKQEKADKLVVGLPIGLDGKENENTENVKRFVEELKKEISISVEFVDERFSSRQADAMGGTVSRDEKAAMVILQSYLEQSKQSKQ
jgi:putative Holliday junction resolvase